MLEYLVRLPSGATRWIAYTGDMLDADDPDDRPVDAAIRRANLPPLTVAVTELGKAVKRVP